MAITKVFWNGQLSIALIFIVLVYHIYSAVVLIIQFWGFLAKHSSLKVFRLIPNPSNKFLWVFLLHSSNFCLQPGTRHTGLQQWIRLQACSMLLYPKTCLFTNRNIYNTCIMDLPLFCFLFQFFLQVLICQDSMMQLP